MNIKNIIIKNIVTFFGVGKIAYAPGTFGSLCAFPLLILLLKFIQNNNIFLYYAPIKQVLFFVVLLSVIGIYAINEYLKIANNTDPSEVIIDEIVGQLITTIAIFYFFTYIPKEMFEYYFLSFKNVYNLVSFKLISSFILFRFFDIVKPWPVSYADKKIKGGLGVMLDDIFAAGLGIITFFSMLYIWFWFKFTL